MVINKQTFQVLVHFIQGMFHAWLFIRNACIHRDRRRARSRHLLFRHSSCVGSHGCSSSRTGCSRWNRSDLEARANRSSFFWTGILLFLRRNIGTVSWPVLLWSCWWAVPSPLFRRSSIGLGWWSWISCGTPGILWRRSCPDPCWNAIVECRSHRRHVDMLAEFQSIVQLSASPTRSEDKLRRTCLGSSQPVLPSDRRRSIHQTNGCCLQPFSISDIHSIEK